MSRSHTQECTTIFVLVYVMSYVCIKVCMYVRITSVYLDVWACLVMFAPWLLIMVLCPADQSCITYCELLRGLWQENCLPSQLHSLKACVQCSVHIYIHILYTYLPVVGELPSYVCVILHSSTSSSMHTRTYTYLHVRCLLQKHATASLIVGILNTYIHVRVFYCNFDVVYVRLYISLYVPLHV